VSGKWQRKAPSGAAIADRRRSAFVSGFTLIELLVVIAVIVLLMALLLPSLRKARNQARAAVCQANLKQWGSVLALYTEDSQGLLPDHMGGALWFLRGPSIAEGDPNRPSIFQDIRAEGIACCPMAVRTADDDNAPGHFRTRASASGVMSYQIEGKYGSTFEAWEIIQPRPRFRGSYGFNHWLFQHRMFDTSVPPDHSIRRQPCLNIFPLKNRARIPVLLDGISPDILVISDFPPWSTGACINRHNRHVNALFLDWSVRRIGLKELWTLKWNMQFDTANKWTKAGGMQPEDWPKWMRGLLDY